MIVKGLNLNFDKYIFHSETGNLSKAQQCTALAKMETLCASLTCIQCTYVCPSLRDSLLLLITVHPTAGRLPKGRGDDKGR